MWHPRLQLPSELWSSSSDWSVESNTWAPGFLWGNSEQPSQHWGSWEAFVATAFSLTPSFVQFCSPYSLGNGIPTDVPPQISSTLSFLSQAEIEKNNLHNSSVPLRLSNLSWLLKLLLTCRIIILAFTQFKFLFKWHVNWFKKTNSTTIFTMETAVPVLGLS